MFKFFNKKVSFFLLMVWSDFCSASEFVQGVGLEESNFLPIAKMAEVVRQDQQSRKDSSPRNSPVGNKAMTCGSKIGYGISTELEKENSFNPSFAALYSFSGE